MFRVARWAIPINGKETMLAAIPNNILGGSNTSANSEAKNNKIANNALLFPLLFFDNSMERG